MATSPSITRADFPNYSIIQDTDADGTVEKDVMGGPCRVTDVQVTNGDALTRYVRLFDDKNPTNGTTDPDYVLFIPSSGVKAVMSYHFPEPLVFDNGLSFAMVTVGGTAGTTGPTLDSTVVLTVRPGVS